jgi:hypothetical protein
MEYYSVRARYTTALRGLHLPDVHICFAVDEEKEQTALIQVEKLVSRAAELASIKLLYEYSYPDGSCYRYACTSTTAVFEKKLNVMRRFMKRSAAAKALEVSLEATPIPDATRRGSNSGYLNLVERIRGRAIYGNWHVPDIELLDPCNAWGGMSARDNARYREHRAFKEGFLNAFGHYGDVWNGPPGYVPTQYAQEQAGAAHALGLLLHLLCYKDETEAARVGI